MKYKWSHALLLCCAIGICGLIVSGIRSWIGEEGILKVMILVLVSCVGTLTGEYIYKRFES